MSEFQPFQPKPIVEICFSALFDFAEKEFGVSWNSANDLFFDTILTYKSVDKFRPEEAHYDIEWFSDRYDETCNWEDIPREYIDSAEDYEKANIILLAFIQKNKISHELHVRST